MVSKITLSSVNGATAPYTLYVCDSNGNNCSIMATSPLSLPQDYVLPTFFNGAPSVMLKIVDSNDCEYFEILPCQSA